MTKFLKCINWETAPEVRQALNLLAQWAPMNVEDALELLSPSFTHPAVRRYAISRLKQAPDEDLFLYLLQLVQALKYENFDNIFEAYRKIMPEKEILKSIDDNPCYDQSTDSIGSSSELSISSQHLLHQQNQQMSSTRSSISSILIPNQPISVVIDHSTSIDQIGGLNVPIITTGGSNSSNDSDDMLSNTLMSDTQLLATQQPHDLAGFLIQRACNNPTLANYLYWYLSIECEDQETVRKQDEKVREMYEAVWRTFLKTLQIGSPELRQIHANLKKQQCFIDKLVKLVKTVAKESGNRKKKTEKFQQLLADTDIFKINFSNFECRPFPLDPEIQIKGIIPNRTILFKSALMPAK